MIETADLPVNWTSVELSEVGEWGSGGTPTTKNPAYYGGSIPWLKIGDLTDGPVDEAEVHITDDGLNASAAKLLPPDTLLLAMYGSIGKLGITRIPCATNQAIAFCNPKQRIVDLKYLFFQLRYLRPHLVSLGQGGTQQNISQTILKRMQIALAPQQEQHRIVEKIETLFARINKGEEALREVQKLLKRYRQSILKAAVTGELTRDWREANQHKLEPASALLARILETRRESWQGHGKYKEPLEADGDALPKLPAGWVWATMDQLGEVLGGLTKNSKRMKLPLKRPMLRVANVYQSRLSLEEIHETGVSEKELARVSLEPLDILIVEGNGSKDQIGRMAIWRNEIPDAVHQNHLIKARLFEKQLADYTLAWFQSPNGRQVVEYVASSTSGLYTLSLSKIKQLTVPLPSLSEAQEIVAEVQNLFSQADELEDYCTSELRRSASLRQSILKSAFTGQLVSQDSKDEPASELLARIRAEREAKPKKRSKKKVVKKSRARS